MAATPTAERLSLKLKDKHTARAVDALCGLYGYPAEVVTDPRTGAKGANPQSRLAFAEARVEAFVKDVIKAFEANQAAEAARQAAVAKADLELD